MSSLEVSKLSFVKAQLYGLDFANATFYLRTPYQSLTMLFLKAAFKIWQVEN